MATWRLDRWLEWALFDLEVRITLGLFVGTFVYSMVILARITDAFTPQLGVGVAAVLVVLSLAAYVVLVSHLRTSLRPVVVATRVGRLGRQALGQLYRESAGPAPPPPPAHRPAAPRPTRTVVNRAGPGILVAFDADGLVAEARRAIVERELALLTETVRRGFADADDQARAAEPDHRGWDRRPVCACLPPADRRSLLSGAAREPVRRSAALSACCRCGRASSGRAGARP